MLLRLRSLIGPLALAAGLLAAARGVAQEAYEGAVRHAEVPDASVPVMTRGPELLQPVEPAFPDGARALALSADVTLRLLVGTDGRVEKVDLVKPAGHGFDEAATAAARGFVFRPAEIDGKPGPVQVEFTQHFTWTAPPPTLAPAAPPIATLVGTVLEKGNRHPVPGATVLVDGGTPAETDAAGVFTVVTPPGKVAVSVRDSSHQPFEATETLAAGERLEVRYYLTPKAVGLYETTVHGERERKEVSRRTLQREELEKVPGAFGDPLRVLQSLPGVARPSFGSGVLLVRGSSPNDTGVYFDGIQIPLLYHFGGGPSVVNPELVDRIDFYPGGFGAEYGRAIGGVVDVGPRTAAADGLVHATAKADFIDAAAYASAQPLPGLSMSVSGRRSYVDALLPLVLRGTTVISPEYTDYQAKVDYRPPGTRHSVGLFAFGSEDTLHAVIGRGSSTNIDINTAQGFFRVEGAWGYAGDRFTHKAQVYAGLNTQSFGVGELRADQLDRVGGFREKAQVVLNEHLTVRGGADVQLTQARLTSFSPAPPDYRGFPGEQADPTLVSQASQHDLFPYAEWAELRLTAGPLKVMPGLRAEQYREVGRWRTDFDPRLIARLERGPEGHRSELKGSVGLYHENPPLGLLDAERGNPDLRLQAALQTSLGFEHDFTDVLSLDVTGFYNRRFDLAQRVNVVTVADDGTVSRKLADNVGLGRAYGLEVFIRRRITEHFFGWLAYTLSWSEERRQGDATYHWASFDQRHILSAVAQYKLGNGWEFGGRFQLTTGDPTTPIVGSTFDGDTLGYRPISGAAGSTRLPTFHQLDLRVDHTWLFNRWMLGVYLDVQNVYNQPNQEAVLNDYRFRTQTVVTGLPLIPVLGLKGSY